tara:strand:+ start:47 stop:1612 length:1566 start_codon:yes stop_codon:yes gene_type:complete
MALKVMFIYPNHKGMNMLPPGIALLSACLKSEGFEVELFDTTYYDTIDGSTVDSDKSKSDRLMARSYTMPSPVAQLTMTLKHSDVYEDFLQAVTAFGPDLLALSATEDMFLLGTRLLKKVRHLKILTIAGGVFPTFAPEVALSYPEINIVCKGEGEDALVELCRRLDKGKEYDDINNLWIRKKDGSIRKNLTRMTDMDKNPLIDMSIFEEARFYRPMGGQVYRMFPVETHRGCPYPCTFCNSPTQMELYRAEEGKSYLRRKSFDNMKRELLFYKNEMKAEYLYFWADTFFSWKQGEFEEFAELYKEIGLPFWCQTRVETVNKRRLQVLRDMGCARISFGLEHGNDEFRRKYIRRHMTNDIVIRSFGITKEVGIPFSVNNIVGFPHETYELAFDTVRLNRQFDADDRNAYPFTPFTGTPMREDCEKLGFLKKGDIVNSLVAGSSILDMPQFSAKQIQGLIKTFNMYVKFPESRWPEIKRAEEASPEGKKIYSELKKEFVETFWKADNTSFENSSVNHPMNSI